MTPPYPEDDPRYNPRLAALLSDEPPTRGYVEDVQRHIDDPDFDDERRRVGGGERAWRG